MIADFTRFVPWDDVVNTRVAENQVREHDRKLEAILRDCPVGLYDYAGREVSVRVEQMCNFEFICITPYPDQPIAKIRPVRAIVDGYMEFKRSENQVFLEKRDRGYENYFIVQIVEKEKPTFFIHTMNPFVSHRTFMESKYRIKNLLEK